jgi:hypothetical protein
MTDVTELTVRARFPLAQAVYLLGEFNQWSTAATPMSYVGRGIWEAHLTVGTQIKRVAYFVWQCGRPFGQILYGDDAAPENEPHASLDAAVF